jgi:hypothetical protein
MYLLALLFIFLTQTPVAVNEIQSEGGKAIGEALKVNKSLMFLGLGSKDCSFSPFFLQLIALLNTLSLFLFSS